MSTPAENKAVGSSQVEKKGGYPAGRPVSSGPMPAKFPSRPAPAPPSKKS